MSSKAERTDDIFSLYCYVLDNGCYFLDGRIFVLNGIKDQERFEDKMTILWISQCCSNNKTCNAMTRVLMVKSLAPAMQSRLAGVDPSHNGHIGPLQLRELFHKEVGRLS